LKKVVQEAVLHVAVQLHSAVLRTVAEGNGKSSVTANKFLKVVADVWVNWEISALWGSTVQLVVL
jgi:hypothetical protein